MTIKVIILSDNNTNDEIRQLIENQGKKNTKNDKENDIIMKYESITREGCKAFGGGI